VNRTKIYIFWSSAALLKIENLIQFLIRYIKDHMVRRQRFFTEKLGEPVIRGCKACRFIKGKGCIKRVLYPEREKDMSG